MGERIVWKVVDRERPGVTEPNAIVRGGTATDGVSFVSGHVVLVTGLAWVITPYLRGRWRIMPWLVVALVGFARMYLGAHNPLDVLGGFALGVAIGAVVNLLVKVPAAGADTEEPGREAPAPSKRLIGRGSLAADLHRRAHERAVLGPRAVVVLDVLVAQQLLQREPGVARTLTDPAVRDDLAVAGDALVGVELLAARPPS